MSVMRQVGVGRRRRTAAAVLLGLTAAAGAYVASASTLGSLRTTGLGADEGAVSRCDTNGVTVSYLNEYDATTDTYRSVEVSLGDVAAACNGLPFKLTLASPTASVRELTGTIALAGGTRQNLTLSPAIPSTSITRTSLVISG